jgi:hypothetical protein
MNLPRWSLLIFFCACFALVGCGPSPNDGAYDEREEVSEERAEFDEDSAMDEAVADLSGETFQDVGDTSRCTQDCSGHDAGWQWAQDNDVTDSSECSGSGSFADGCEAYVEELESRVEEARYDIE